MKSTNGNQSVIRKDGTSFIQAVETGRRVKTETVREWKVGYLKE